MNIKFFGFIIFIFIVGTFLGFTFEEIGPMSEEATMTVGDEEMTFTEVMDAMTSFDLRSWTDVWGPIKIPTFLAVFFSVVAKVITWDYAFFTGGWEYARWFIFIPISAMVAFGVTVLFVQLMRGLITT